MRLGLTSAAAAVASVIAWSATAAPSALVSEGPAQVVFDYSRDACETWDVPDAPARAWRDAEGVIRMVAGATRSRALTGPSLASVRRRDCSVLHEGARSDDPGRYDDFAWLSSIYTGDGRHVEALVHVEYQGHRRPDRCAAGEYDACWRNAITRLVSSDGGVSFAPPDEGRLVATAPYRYTGREGGRTGYFSPSNIFRADDHLHVFIRAEALGAQQAGTCLLRRPADTADAPWRAFDGAAFRVDFLDPYAETGAAGDHVCAPVGGLRSTLWSVLRHEPTGAYLGVTATTLRTGDGTPTSGIWWTASTDLLDWSRPRLLMAAPLLWRPDCVAREAFHYPSLLDDDGPSRMFDAADDRFWLYLTRFALDEECRPTPERDLVRIPVRALR